MRAVLVIGRVALLTTALAACQLGGAKPASDIAAPAALQGPAVEVTPLAPLGAAPEPTTPQPGAQPIPDQKPQPKPQPRPEPKPAVKPEPKPEAATEQPTPVAKPKSASEIACEKRKGQFVPIGKSGAMTCQMPTRDGGKQCHRESDCEGVCLARSNTCAPVKPLLGCQAILQNDGRQVELCID